LARSSISLSAAATASSSSEIGRDMIDRDIDDDDNDITSIVVRSLLLLLLLLLVVVLVVVVMGSVGYSKLNQMRRERFGFRCV
jgi:hypothetical protein